MACSFDLGCGPSIGVSISLENAAAWLLEVRITAPSQYGSAAV
jgi:hypothetical protein